VDVTQKAMIILMPPGFRKPERNAEITEYHKTWKNQYHKIAN